MSQWKLSHITHAAVVHPFPFMVLIYLSDFHPKMTLERLGTGFEKGNEGEPGLMEGCLGSIRRQREVPGWSQWGAPTYLFPHLHTLKRQR